jgi:hypothetical protein
MIFVYVKLAFTNPSLICASFVAMKGKLKPTSLPLQNPH